MKSMYTSLSLLLLLLSTPLSSYAAKNDYSNYISSTTTTEGSILLLGDSWASLSGQYAANICGLSSTRQVTNDAKAGTTAKQWAESETAIQSMEKAEFDYEYVWISLGGNDFLDNKCDISTAEQVASNIVTVISHVVDNSSNENIKILYFGYSVPSQDVCKNGMTAQLFEEQGAIIFETIQASDYAKYVTLVDISEMFVKTSWGGSSSSSNGLSDSYYYYDEIHLNQLGYLHLFSSYRIQRFFGCSAAQTVELKGISAALEAKDNPAHLAGTIITTLLGLLMGIIGLVLVVNFIKRKMAMRGGMSSSGGSSSINSKELLDESENTGDYVVVKEEPAVMA